jgi:hypothetical protein
MLELTSKDKIKKSESEPNLLKLIQNDKNSINNKQSIESLFLFFKENTKETYNEQINFFYHEDEDKKLSSESFLLFFNDLVNKDYNEQIKDFNETEINLSNANTSDTISFGCIDEIKEPEIEKIFNVNNIEEKYSELINGILSISKNDSSSEIKFNIFEKRSEYSLYLFSKENSIRKFCYYLTLQKWFENVILLFVALNCITLAMERPSIIPTSLVSILN